MAIMNNINPVIEKDIFLAGISIVTVPSEGSREEKLKVDFSWSCSSDIWIYPYHRVLPSGLKNQALAFASCRARSTFHLFLMSIFTAK